MAGRFDRSHGLSFVPITIWRAQRFSFCGEDRNNVFARSPYEHLGNIDSAQAQMLSAW
jgi:hypothetical protein